MGPVDGPPSFCRRRARARDLSVVVYEQTYRSGIPSAACNGT
ncbi:hypothetical protein QBA75_08235 [Streptomyces stelliscabiei]